MAHLSTLATFLLLVCTWGKAGFASIKPVGLQNVRLDEHSIQARYESVNAKYLLDMLDPDRLLLVFRLNAGLPAPGKPFIASWEDPGCELRGHFVGHYLTALSLAWAGTGNVRFKERLTLMVGELAKVQDKLGSGYLSAFPSEHFDRMENLTWVWAPYYVIHKIMAGLLDAHELAGLQQGLPMAARMADYHLKRSDELVAKRGHEHWIKVLDVEFGGMNEVLFRLHRLTGYPNHLRFAKMFIKPRFRDPMVQGIDMLAGLHANTHLAQAVGYAEEYDTTGEAAARAAVENFFDMVTQHHSFATGGSSLHEFWQPPDEVADAVLKNSDAHEVQETCTQYNILKVARALFRWTGAARYADFYERALLNGIHGVARLPPEDWPEAGQGPRSLMEVGGTGGHHHHRHIGVQGMAADMLQQQQGGALQQQPAVLPGGLAVAATVPEHQRTRNEQWLPYWAFAKPQPDWNASDAHGPGVFLYLLHLGTGVSKADNIHHWGFPFHSFWCCYGTAVEAFAKLGDSIYFEDVDDSSGAAAASNAGVSARKLRKLYVNQLVASTLSWGGVKLAMTADMYAPGPAANATLEVLAVQPDAATFTLMLRIPGWVPRGAARVSLNGADWTGCPGRPEPNTFCEVTRTFGAGDHISLRLPMRWWLKALPERRLQYKDLQALMLGPFMMVPLSHGDRQLVVEQGGLGVAGREFDHATPPRQQQQQGGSRGSDSDNGLPGGLRAYPPEEADELLSVQSGWNASLFLRHDAFYAYVSALGDGGDAMDATFRLGRSCYHGAPSQAEGQQQADEAAGTSSAHSWLSSAYQELRAHMRMGAHDSAHHISLEAMAFPNHFLAADRDGVIVLQPGAPSDQADGSAAASGSGPGAQAQQLPDTAAACSASMWMMRPGLDGQPGSVSFEAAHMPNHYISGLAGGQSLPCADAPGMSCGRPNSDMCMSQTFESRVLCRASCGTCETAASALRLRKRAAGDAAFAGSASFRLAPAARRAYPAGSHVLAALNRHFLVAPIGNLIDERYTAYMHVKEDEPGLEALA